MEHILLRGEIVHGKGAGHRFGMPTANLVPEAGTLLPPCGVYGALLRFDGEEHRAVTNVGTRPSDDTSSAVTVESWLPDYSGDLYGKRAELELCFFLREIRHFPGGLSEVAEQVRLDAEKMNRLMETGEP